MWRDLKHDAACAIRMLLKTPSFTAVAVITLALGIGATTAIFSLANWTMFRPVAGVSDPDRVAVIWSGRWTSQTSFRPSRVSYPNFHDIAPTLKSVSGFAAYQGGGASVAAEGAAARPVSVQFVTASFFDVLGLRMQAGRPFTLAEDDPAGAGRVVVISDRLWSTIYQRDPRALQTPLLVNGLPFSVVGVAPRGFHGTERLSDADLWLPGASYPMVNHMPTLRYDSRTTGGFYEFVARLAPGATWEQVSAEFQTLGPWLAAQHPEDNANFLQSGLHMFGPIGMHPMPGARSQLRSLLGLMMAASAIVLLIACANVASLLVLRGVGRQNEVAVRKALGATRYRLVRQHVTEGVCLWALGGAAAMLVVLGLMQVVEASALIGVTHEAEVPLDWRVAVFSAALSLVVGLLFSVVPAFRTARAHAAETLRNTSVTTSGRSLTAGTALTVVQLSASVALLIGAFLLSSTVRHLSNVPLGFDADNVFTFRLAPSQLGYTAAAGSAYLREFERRLQQTPGVDSVALAQAAPFGGRSNIVVRPQGAIGKADVHETLFNAVASPSYFELLQIPLLRGRLFDRSDFAAPDGRSRPVVILSENLAREIFDSIAVEGRMLEFPVLGREKKVYEIIGVVGTSRFSSLTGEPDTLLYEPAGMERSFGRDAAAVLVRVSEGRDPSQEIRAIAASLNSALPVGRITPLTEAIERARAQWTGLARLLEVLAAIAAILSAVGLYGVVAFGVAQRRREFGIRMALGAAPARIVQLVMRRTAVITACGLVGGLAAAAPLTRTIESRLVGVAPFDPWVWATAAAALVAIALLASLVPARRATRIAVTDTLRAN